MTLDSQTLKKCTHFLSHSMFVPCFEQFPYNIVVSQPAHSDSLNSEEEELVATGSEPANEQQGEQLPPQMKLSQQW